MKTFIIKTILLIFALILTIGVAFWTPDADKDELISKYSNQYSQFVLSSDGSRIHYRNEGLAEGPVLVLLHGNHASLHTWEPLVAELSDTFRLISIDFPGHGLTGPNTARDYSANALIQSVNTVLDHLNVQHALVAGNSMGGWIAWRFALQYPDRVAGLVLIDASGAITDEPIRLYTAAKISRSKIGQLITPRITPKFLVRKSLTQVMWNDDSVSDELVDRYWDLARYPGNRIAMVDRMQVDREPGFWHRIGDIDKPALILWGEHDQTIPVSHARAFNAALENSQLKIYANAAHAPMEEQPTQVAADIRAWYDKTISVVVPVSN